MTHAENHAAAHVDSPEPVSGEASALVVMGNVYAARFPLVEHGDVFGGVAAAKAYRDQYARGWDVRVFTGEFAPVFQGEAV